MERINRNHKLLILSNSMKSLKDYSFIILISLTKGLQVALLVLLGFFIISFIYSLLKWLNISYRVDAGILSYKQGILNKATIELPLDRITTFDVNQSIIQRLFKAASVKIDSGGAPKKSEVSLLLSENEIEKLKALLGRDISNKVSPSQDENPENNIRFIHANLKDIVIFSVTRNNFALALGAFLSLYNFLDDIFNAFNIDIEKNLETLTNSLTLFNGSIYIVIIEIIGLILLFAIIITIISTAICIVRYSDFKVSREYTKLNISYGLITKHNYTFSIDKVNAIALKQNLLRQFLGLYKVQLSAVGYGDDKKEDAILYPICSKEKYECIIAKLLPEFIFTEEIHKAPKEARLRFFTVPISLFIIISTIVSLLFPKTIFIWPLFLSLIAFLCYMNYKNSALGFSERILYTSKGGLSKQINLIPIKKLQAFAYKSNYFQRKKNLCNYRFYQFGSFFAASAKNIKNSHVESIRKVL